MSAPTTPPELPAPQPVPSGQWAFPTDERGEPKKKYVLWIVFGAAGCFVAIVVLGLVATLVIPQLVRRAERAQQARARADVKFLCVVLGEYADSHGGKYPDSLEALVQPDRHGHTLLREAGELPRDPWDRAYHYKPPTPELPMPDVYSLGRDGLPGGSGADEDVHATHLAPEDR